MAGLWGSSVSQNVFSRHMQGWQPRLFHVQSAFWNLLLVSVSSPCGGTGAWGGQGVSGSGWLEEP